MSNSLNIYDQRKRLDKLETVDHAGGMKLIFEWVKTGHVNVKEFIALIKANDKLEETK